MKEESIFQKKRSRMKQMYRCYTIVLACMFFGASLPLLSDNEVVAAGKDMEIQDQEMLYIRFDKEVSNISDVIFEISLLDPNVDSPVHLLKKHLDNGYLLGI